MRFDLRWFDTYIKSSRSRSPFSGVSGGKLKAENIIYYNQIKLSSNQTKPISPGQNPPYLLQPTVHIHSHSDHFIEEETVTKAKYEEPYFTLVKYFYHYKNGLLKKSERQTGFSSLFLLKFPKFTTEQWALTFITLISTPTPSYFYFKGKASGPWRNENFICGANWAELTHSTQNKNEYYWYYYNKILRNGFLWVTIIWFDVDITETPLSYCMYRVPVAGKAWSTFPKTSICLSSVTHM